LKNGKFLLNMQKARNMQLHCLIRWPIEGAEYETTGFETYVDGYYFEEIKFKLEI